MKNHPHAGGFGKSCFCRFLGAHNFSLPQSEYHAILCHVFFKSSPYFAHMSKPPVKRICICKCNFRINYFSALFISCRANALFAFCLILHVDVVNVHCAAAPLFFREYYIAVRRRCQGFFVSIL